MQLLVESTRVCYERFRENQEKIGELDEEITALRAQLRLKILDKQDRTMQNEKMYSYLHSVLGPDMMERLDSHEEEE